MKGQAYGECRTLPLGTFNGNASAVGGDDALDDGQTETHAQAVVFPALAVRLKHRCP